MHATEKILHGYRIKPMKEEDLDAVLAIEEVSFPNPWTRRMFASELKNPVSHAYTLKVPHGNSYRLAAYIVFWVVYGEAHILNLSVHPDYRRQGIGEELLSAALDMMQRSLVYEVFLEVRKSNEAAIALYRKLDFKESYEREKYYGDEDAIVMTLHLDW